MKDKKLLAIAIVLGFITVIMLNYYLRFFREETPPFMAEKQVNVVVARTTIPQHTRITAEMLGTEAVLEEAVHPEALRSIDDAVGAISRSEIIRGEQLLGSRIASEERRASLSYRVPPGLRAISIPVEEVPGVSGFISPGDRVDVLVAYNIFKTGGEEAENTLTVYTAVQNALVLATGAYTREADNEEQRLVNTVTVAVTPAQAEVLAFAYLQGSFHLTLRSPLDEDVAPLDYYNVFNFETFRER